ncbi:hypothetical protein BTA51_25130 [Hahella sp. CCB-MM4]|uniref:DUF1631 domain-containing protein n=1 Tax=Hahella sp. (strain CCB-MM4) TaxID=1926491 RepID=UPI000B9B1BE7|nr:DUF1631 domain-containing protein [Hahella sp. CCB-MM4]OZG70650.1 hypothetical protein BTA51_25130 [Hahella sp. CCB-MM4]
MNKGSGVSYMHEHLNARTSPSNESLKQRIRNNSISLLSDHLNAMFDGIDDSFFELANHAHTNNEQNRYFEAMREVRIKRKGIESFLQQTLEDAFEIPPEAGEKNQDSSDDIEMEDLTLVHNDALEESVAIESMVSKAKANFSGSLMQFQTRVSTLYSDRNNTKQVNPLDPELICRAFAEVCSGLEIEIKEKLIVFKQFDRHVMNYLVELLDSGNNILVKAGILLNLKYTTTNNRSQPTRSQPSNESNDGAEILGNDNFPPESDVFEQAQELLASLRSTGDSSQTSSPVKQGGKSHSRQGTTEQTAPSGNQGRIYGGTGYSGPPQLVEGPQLVNMLTGLQDSMIADNLAEGPVVAVDLKAAVKGILDEQAKTSERPTTISQVDEDLINLVSMLFEFILDDYNLSAPVQVMISRLQIPILKVAIRDKSFFSKPSHPARKLLNALAKASIGWSDASEKTRDKLYQQIHDVVHAILEDFDGDISLFERLHESFNNYLSREERKSKLVEQRTKEAEIGRVKSQKAKLVVDRILYEKISSTAIPQVALDLLKSGWSRVMFLVYLKEGRGHRFSQCVKVVDELIWCLQIHSEEEARKRWVQVVPKLLKNLKVGLKEVAYNTGRLDEMLLDLKKQLTQTFKQQSVTAALKDSPKPPPLTDLKAAIDAAEKKKVHVNDASLAHYLEQIDSLETGEWVEFKLVNGSRFRCKLSTALEESDSLIFVNRLGLKVVEKTRAELAEELNKGTMIILESGMLIDRAIDSVMNNLRKMSGKVA